MGNLKTLAGGYIDKVTIQFVSGGETDGVHNAVEAIPLFAEFRENGINSLVAGDITGETQGFTAAIALCGFEYAAFQLVILIGES